MSAIKTANELLLNKTKVERFIQHAKRIYNRAELLESESLMVY